VRQIVQVLHGMSSSRDARFVRSLVIINRDISRYLYGSECFLLLLAYPIIILRLSTT
jgi:hypothetical protein